MRVFNKQFKNENYYRDNILEVINLCDVINSLPGLEIICTSPGKDSELNIWFNVTDTTQGLFFLTRSTDRRYWEYGHLWTIDLSVGDAWDGKNLPITYRLSNNFYTIDNNKIDEVLNKIKQVNSLIDNITHHLNHDGFISGFNLDVSHPFWLSERDIKLNNILGDD